MRAVQRVEAGTHAGCNLDYLVDRQRPLRLQPLVEGPARHVAHGEVLMSVDLAEVDHAHEVLVLHLGRCARLTCEASAVLRVPRPLPLEDLEGHRLPVVALRAEDLAHTALTEQSLDAVATERRARLRGKP